MTVDPDEQLGAELDSYLSSLEEGGPSAAVGDHKDSGELATLKSLVGELHQLARLVDAGSQGEALAPSTDVPERFGKYHLQRELGSGGQSRTWLAHDLQLNRLVVLKLYRGEDGLQRERVLQEARAFAQVDSPFVAHCYEVDQHGETPYLALEHISGRSLDHILRERRLPWQRSVEITLDIAQGLAAVHARGLVHRDIKPANVVVADNDRVTIVDFGMAQIQSTPADSIAGTPAYLAPEQARGEIDRVGPRTDVFGAGAVLYELLTGRPPFRSSSRKKSVRLAAEGVVAAPRTINRGVPRVLNDICLRCLASDPMDRFESMDELADALRNATIGRSAAPLVVAAAVLLAIAAGIVIASRPFDDARPVSLGPPREESPVTPATHVAESALPADALEFFAVDGRLRRDFWVELDILGARRNAAGTLRLTEGDRIAFRVRAQRDCYVTILSYGPEAPVQLFPQAPFDGPGDGYVIANQPQTLPRIDSRQGAVVRAVPSQGKEALCVVASTNPISLGNNADGQPLLVFDSAAERNQLKDQLRGLIRQAETSNYAVSQLIVPYWVEPAAGTRVN